MNLPERLLNELAARIALIEDHTLLGYRTDIPVASDGIGMYWWWPAELADVSKLIYITCSNVLLVSEKKQAGGRKMDGTKGVSVCARTFVLGNNKYPSI